MQRNLWFNYRTEHTQKWASEDLQRKHEYTARYPDATGAVVISLAPVAVHR